MRPNINRPDCCFVGVRLGRALAERYTQDRARMSEQLDVIKWACKELWGEVFRKQVTTWLTFDARRT